MSSAAPLVTLLPIRDARERTIAFELRAHPISGHAPPNIDAEARALLSLLQRRDLLRAVRGRPLHVPITPAVLRGGAITGFASADVVFTLAADALDDDDTRRALEKYATAGFRFGFVLDATRADAPPALASALHGSWVALDATQVAGGLALASTLQRLLESGARPIARQVDDRATRERLRASGVQGFTGRPLPRGHSASDEARVRAVAALTLLARFADGRPADASIEEFITNDPEIGRSVFRATSSAAMGTTRPRTLTQAFLLLGRDAMLDRLLVATAFLLGDSAGDPEIAAIAIRRGRTLERLGAAIERAGHPRARMVAGLLSIADVATGIPPVMLAETLGAGAAVRDLLIERQTPLGALLDVVEAHEFAWWDDLFTRADRLGLAPQVVGDAWLASWLDARSETSARASAEA
jgi:c-di-GMP-related signal transduction protein